jgi:hypothetical protein
VEVMGQLSNFKTRLHLTQLAGAPCDRPVGQEREMVIQRRLRRLNPNDTARLIESYLNGATLSELASGYSVNRTTASTILQRAGVRRRGIRLCSFDVEEAIRLYESGQSLLAVANLFKVSPNSIRNHLLKAGVKTRNSHGFKQ